MITQTIQRGFRDKLDKYLNPDSEIGIYMEITGNDSYDYCCFGVDSMDKLSDDRYMVFYNQPSSPGSEITYSAVGVGARFNVNLSKLPAGIAKLVFTVSIDGNGNMGTIASHKLRIIQNGQPAAELVLNGSDFSSEKAIISIEIYKKDVWRFAAVARGFNGGLGDLLKAYGGEIAEESAPAAPNYANDAYSQFAPGNIPHSGGSQNSGVYAAPRQTPSAPQNFGQPVRQSNPQSAPQVAPQPVRQSGSPANGFIPAAIYGDVGNMPKSTVSERPSNIPQPTFGSHNR